MSESPSTDEGREGHEPLLSLQHASKSFGAVQALEDVSIDLFAGEVHALVGENGAGKSTLVKIFAGVHPPDTGSILVHGQRGDSSTARPMPVTPGSRSSTRSRSSSPT